MIEHTQALPKYDYGQRGLGRYSKMPVIRSFESLLTDEDFASAGLKIAQHPNGNTFYVYAAADRLTDGDKGQKSANVLSSGSFVASHNLLWIDPLSDDSAEVDVTSLVERVDELRSLARDEELPFNEKSAKEAIAWARSAAFPRLPSVFLVNNGNTRLFWRHGKRQLGIQFLQDGAAQFVYLGEDDAAERIYGSIKVLELQRLIGGLDLRGLLGFEPIGEHQRPR